ncbi:hypothetical protein JCM14076_22730 [Methylosoma difficile]
MNAHFMTTDPLFTPDLVMAGDCGYEIIGQQAIITIAEIANNRNQGMISGTLAVELWALPHAYNGGDFSGSFLAGTCIGELYDQHYLANCRYELDFQEPSEGEWTLVLMLREWMGDAYVTRDYMNFAVPYLVDNKPAIIRHEDSNVINVSFPDNKKASAKSTAKKAKPAVKTKQTVSETPLPVSLNEADIKDVAAIKGVSKSLAESIVAARPIDSWEALLKIKGMGPKLLEKIRALVSL